MNRRCKAFWLGLAIFGVLAVGCNRAGPPPPQFNENLAAAGEVALPPASGPSLNASLAGDQKVYATGDEESTTEAEEAPAEKPAE